MAVFLQHDLIKDSFRLLSKTDLQRKQVMLPYGESSKAVIFCEFWGIRQSNFVVRFPNLFKKTE
jgi:hypothetical protein